MTLWTLAAGRLALLAFPALLGVVAAVRGWVRDVPGAIDGLNAFALYVGFPALIAVGVLDGDFALPTNPVFWAVVPCAQLVLVALSRPLARLAGPPAGQAGTLALTGLFANVAYLGLPMAVALLGDGVRGRAALVVSVHVALAVGLGPWLLARWGGGTDRGSLGRVLRQPLLWAPWVGLAGRALPTGPRDLALAALSPLAAAAAPVALFLLGLYLHHHRHRLGRPRRDVAVHVVLRLAVGPAVTAGLVALALPLGLAPADGALFVLLAAMPAAITTFSMAHGAGVGSERVAATILWSTLLAPLTVPLWVALWGLGG